jgi:peptidoglycan/LPS O-acetylase OafA/YrhL
MKLNDRQLDNIARCLGNLGVGAAIGAVVGFAGHTPKPLTLAENAWLGVAAMVCFSVMVLIGNIKGK